MKYRISINDITINNTDIIMTKVQMWHLMNDIIDQFYEDDIANLIATMCDNNIIRNSLTEIFEMKITDAATMEIILKKHNPIRN